MTQKRQYFDLEFTQLLEIYQKHGHQIAVLGQLREELEFRDTSAARDLLKVIQAVSRGEIKRPQPPESRWPTEQGELL